MVESVYVMISKCRSLSVSVLAIIIREVAVERGDLGVTTKLTAAAAALVTSS